MATFNEYLLECANTPDAQRHGQWAFNVLYSMRPDIANKVRASIRDPFYQDGKLPAFYEWVEKQW